MTKLLSILLIAFCCLSLTTALLAQPSPPPDPSKIQVLIITGQNVHDWRGTTPLLKKVLEDTRKFEVRIVEEFRGAGPETLANYDLLVVNYYNRGEKDRWDMHGYLPATVESMIAIRYPNRHCPSLPLTMELA